MFWRVHWIWQIFLGTIFFLDQVVLEGGWLEIIRLLDIFGLVFERKGSSNRPIAQWVSLEAGQVESMNSVMNRECV